MKTNPPKYTTIEGVQERIEAYFEKCEKGETVTALSKKGEPVTYDRKIPMSMAGLAEALEMDRDTLNNYGKGRHESVDAEISVEIVGAITHARRRIETDNITKGMTGEYESRINSLNLSANYGYSTKTETEHSGKLSLEDALRNLED